MAKTQTSFQLDERTVDTMKLLREKFGETTNVGVIRKALALARAAVEHERDDHTITFQGKDDEKITILLNG
ncbi:MAG: hypothetical protein IID49_01895 [Proteobacteria bacterium]|nr:hypothetical protein [Pseudomonadota bacterium]MCH8950864.1 hypothetical protein [Pseudomonadota bacterium]